MLGKAAWQAVLKALPAHWRVGSPTRDPGVDTWSVAAHGDPPLIVLGMGESEIAALRDLDSHLRGVEQPYGSTEDHLVRVARLALIDAAVVADDDGNLIAREPGIH